MANELDKAEAQYQAGEYKRAVDTLWEVTFLGDDAETTARRLLALATRLKEVTTGAAQRDCDEHIARAERYLEIADGPEARARRDQQSRSRLEEAVRLAREARAAGLTWLEIRQTEDVILAEMDATLATARAAGAAPPPSLIDAIEAEGWRLEHVAPMFRATRVQTSVLRGAEYFMGGEVIEGDEVHLYLFRRVDGAPDGPA